MGKWAIFLLIFLIQTTWGKDALAPHPIIFSMDGKPTSIKIDINGIWYDVNWDGASLDLEYGDPPPYGSDPPNEGPFDGWDWDDKDPFDWKGFWFIMTGSVILTVILCAAIIYFS